MKYTLSQKLDRPTLARFFKDAWNAEASSDIETLHGLFENIWGNIDEDPSFEEYNEEERAQLFRHYGYFLSHYGQAKNLPFYQERGKNLLTNAINLFFSLDLSEKALETEIILGLCYFYEGAIAESETIYEHIADQFSGNHLHPLYLRTKINLTLVLNWKGEYQKALEVIEEIEVPMEFCSDSRLLTSYHNQAGLIYRGINQYDRAVYHYNKCIEISQQENNWLVVGKNHNNLAYLYKNTGDFDLAHYHIEQALHIFRGLNHTGFLPHSIDTKAVIYLSENKFAPALETINEAVSAFQKGDDYAGFVEALWNKSKSLLGLNRKEEAVENFIELCRIAQLRIGDFAVRRYSKLFAEIIDIRQNAAPEKKFSRFKTLEMISEQRVQKEKSNKQKPRNPKQINKIEFQSSTFSFPEERDSFLQSEIKTFYVAAEMLSNFADLNEDVILATVPINEPAAGKYILAKKRDSHEYILSSLFHDQSLDIFYLLNNEEPFPLEEINIIGQIAGYCLFTEADKEILSFQNLPTD